MRDILKARWVKAAVETIDSAIAELNARPRYVPWVLVWGFQDQEALVEEETQPTLYMQQEGLLSRNNLDFDFRIQLHRSGGGGPDLCTLTAFLEEHPPLPLAPKELYNVMGCAPKCGSIVLLPDDKSIIVMGVRSTFPVAHVTAKTLLHTLDELAVSFSLLSSRMEEGKGDDYWAGDGGR
jgi:hypothetical protein